MSVSFEAFFEAVWGYRPYPWQVNLSHRVQESGWPSVLDIPTGAGKSSVLDIALHHLALDGAKSAPRRMILVVDRRVIVDQVGQRAERILNSLVNAAKAPESRHRVTLQEMGSRLRDIVGEDGAPLLHTEVLRGGVPRTDAWASWPHVPVLAASTVDQVGSRLLFRGYGVGSRMRSVHAGLLGCDTQFFLDEVHLARPFADMLAQLSRIRGGSTSAIPRRSDVVQLSATPPRARSGNGDAGRAEVFRISNADRAHLRLARVLEAPKPARLEVVEVKVRSAEDIKRRTVAQAAAQHARDMISEGRQAVAVVVNRVDTARRVWTFLNKAAAPFDAVLVTGRMRPLDQETAIRAITARVGAGRVREGSVRPIVVVATQCIEAGADYDFDGIVTEAASLDALRQRFGRVDRRGELNNAGPDVAISEARGVVLMRSDLTGSVEDPVYRSALPACWAWLTEIAEGEVVDFGISALDPHLDRAGGRIPDMTAPSREPAVLMPAYLDQWVQTSPAPQADPDVSLFLHGIPEEGRSTLEDVQVIWRADIEEDDLDSNASGPATHLFEHLSMAPPGRLEAISLPIWTVKRWLSLGKPSGPDDDVADVEGVSSPLEDEEDSRRVVVWRGRDGSAICSGSDVSPGDVIVVPASYGGIGVHGTFDPEAGPAGDEEGVGPPILDLGDLVQLRQRGSPTLRLDARVLSSILGRAAETAIPDLQSRERDPIEDFREWVDQLRPHVADGNSTEGWISEVLDALGRSPRLILSPLGSWMALGRPIRARTDFVAFPDEMSGIDDETGSFVGTDNPALLATHLRGVGDLAARYGDRLGFPKMVVESLRWAGLLHDVGKADPRFQLWLYGGDEIGARFGPVLAKSKVPRQSAVVRRDARLRAGYPEGQRHELVSVNMLQGSDEVRERVEQEGADWDLVLHLVSSHHGWSRPLAPVVHLVSQRGEEVRFETTQGVELVGRTDHGQARLDSGITERFWRLSETYGRHELAYLEATLRLADHRRSAAETQS